MPLYYLKRLSPTQPPPHGEEGPWWKYEIACGVVADNSICGTRGGAQAEVETYIKTMLNAINKRTFGYQSERLRHAHNAPRQLSAKQHVPIGTR